jgi:hypothetical protein
MAKNDETIKGLMAKVAEKKASLGNKPKVSWRTNAVFKYDGSTHINLNTVSDSKPLVEALSFLLFRQMTMAKAGEMLGVEVSEFEWGGYGMSDWVEDFKMRLSIIKWESEKGKLTILENKLASLVSEEAKTEMELENISKMLS